MLEDKYNRRINYLRLSLTDKCNLRCIYCIPSDGVELLPHDEVLRNEEFLYFIGLFAGLGVKKVRFTGGEPLIRRGAMDIIAGTRELYPDIELCLTTNGILLGEVLDDLHSLGLKRLNISLDTISSERYRRVTGRDCFHQVINNIEKALGYDFNIKINSVLYREFLDELDDFIDFFKDKTLVLRFIERMPFIPDNKFQSFLSSDGLVESLKKIGKLKRDDSIDTNVAVMYKLEYKQSHEIKIGIIPPVTHKFCSRCNRVRLTCDGFLKPCLHSSVEYDLKTPYRMNEGDDAIRDIIFKAVNNKPEEHDMKYNREMNQVCSSIIRTSKNTMSKIGG